MFHVKHSFLRCFHWRSSYSDDNIIILFVKRLIFRIPSEFRLYLHSHLP